MTRAKPLRSICLIIASGCAVLLSTGIAAPAGATPNNSAQWYLSTLSIPQAQAISTGKGVTVGVVDSGVDDTHPALTGQTVGGKCFGSAGGTRPTTDTDGHGTGMAGLIAGTARDSRHLLGVAPAAKIMPLCISVTGTSADASFREMTPAIRYAVDHGAKVISMSVGADEDKALDATVTAFHQAVHYALDHNVIIVAAAGNKPGAEHVVSPAELPGVIGVTGTTRSGTAWSASADGGKALAAPATDILTTDSLHKFDEGDQPVHSDGYATTSGTSNATAIVAGVAALVRAKYPDLDAANVVNRLIRTADHKGSPGRNEQYGYGIVDPVRALTADVPKVDANPLGEPTAPSASPSASDRAAGSAGGTGGGSAVSWIVVGVVVLVAAVVVVVVMSRRRTRRGPG